MSLPAEAADVEISAGFVVTNSSGEIITNLFGSGEVDIATVSVLNCRSVQRSC